MAPVAGLPWWLALILVGCTDDANSDIVAAPGRVGQQIPKTIRCGLNCQLGNDLNCSPFDFPEESVEDGAVQQDVPACTGRLLG